MLQSNKNVGEKETKTYTFWSAKNKNYTTSHNSPDKKNNRHLFNRTASFDHQYSRDYSIELNKKSINQVRYFLQIHKKKMRTALINQNFQQSNISTELSQNCYKKGMRGSKIQNKKLFRKNRFVEIQEFGCIQPKQFSEKQSIGLMARHNKPNLMYNLDLFRKKYSKQLAVSRKGSSNSVSKQMEGVYSSHVYQRNRSKMLKTEQDIPKYRTLTQRQE